MRLPEPVLPVLRGGPVLRWGVLAPGFIAAKFVEALHEHTDQEVIAVASRSLERAEQFARFHGIAQAFGSYERLVADTPVDIVYVAAPHTEHKRLALLAIAAGKHVLVEKPLAVTAADARDIAEAAQAAGVFAMEALHSRFHPRISVIEQVLAGGDLGEVTLATADLSVGFAVDRGSRIYNPALAGGAMLDLGIYPVWFARLALGQPAGIVAFGRRAETGVDAQVSAILTSSGGAQASIATSILSYTSGHASINGTRGRIFVDGRHHLPGGLTVFGAKNEVIAEFRDESGIERMHGLCRQAAWVARHVADGLRDSPLHPLAASIELLETIDAIRGQVAYPIP